MICHPCQNVVLLKCIVITLNAVLWKCHHCHRYGFIEISCNCYPECDFTEMLCTLLLCLPLHSAKCIFQETFEYLMN